MILAGDPGATFKEAGLRAGLTVISPDFLILSSKISQNTSLPFDLLPCVVIFYCGIQVIKRNVQNFFGFLLLFSVNVFRIH